MEYFYDPNGNTTSMFDSRLNIGNGTFSWQYDALNQMTGEKSMASLTRLYEYQYTFDAAGNRTQMKYFDVTSTATTTYTHNDGNQLTQSSTGGPCRYFDYDDNGNLILESDEGGPVRSFDWNEDDRLIEVEKNSSTVQYTYDAMGRRIRRYDPDLDLVTLYYYEGLTVIAEKVSEDQGDYKWNRIFTVAPGVIGQILRISEKIDKEWESLYLHYDAIGNVALQTVSDGSPVQPLDQDAYGNVRLGPQSGYHLTTKEYDSSADLYYFWQRWYDPSMGRFLSKAPYPSHIEHPYGYGKNNPVYYIDTDGAQPTAEQRSRCWCDFILCLENAQPDYASIGILGLLERGLRQLLPEEVGEPILPPAFWGGAVIGVWAGMVRCYAEYEGCLAGYSGNSEPERTLPPPPLPPDEWEFRPGRIPISRNRR